MVVSLKKYRQTRRVKSSVEVPLGERVAIARKNQGMTQEELGWKVGYSQSVISRMETGQAEIGSDDIAAIANVLNNSGLLDRFCEQCPVCRAAAKLKSWPKPAA